ncbi:MAG: archease [Chlorobiaceae bacterium]|nr:archease [Chlorobiaceae bacterium]
MPYRMLEHTADLSMEVTAGSFEELIGEALRAITEWVGPEWAERRAERSFRIEAPDRSMLLVDLLNESLSFAQIHHEAYDALVVSSIGDEFVEGSFTGRAITGARDEIKAVTYHGASVERLADGRWRAILLMDI